MSDELRSIKKGFGGDGTDKPPSDVLQASLQQFAATEQIATFTELKYVCFGVTVPIHGRDWRVIDRSPLFNRLLALVQQKEAQPKQFRRCYQGLLSGYFGFDLHGDHQKNDAPANWETLRGFLSSRQRPVLLTAANRGPTPEWLQVLDTHRNLLDDDPCKRYADELEGGTATELRTVCASLGIPNTSWVWDDALMAYVRLVCDGSDQRFKKGLNGVLDVVNGRVDLKLGQMLATKATSLTVHRYSRCKETPEHPDLRDTCLQWIGNPWLKRTSWDANVDHEPARQMVEGWLKRRLIKDFFELLAQDGAADLRRLNYWLKWEPQITDMWFVWGGDARANQSAAFVELRKRMTGRALALTDPDSQNNAFVMRIGPLLVIEFGLTGNACYVFAAADFKTSLDVKTLTRNQLKQKEQATKLIHISSGWESRFDSALGKLLRSVPTSKGKLEPWVSDRPDAQKAPGLTATPAQPVSRQNAPASARSAANTMFVAPPVSRALNAFELHELRTMCRDSGVELEDNRSKGGALWVLMRDPLKNLRLAAALNRHGFQLAIGKGYWLKNES